MAQVIGYQDGIDWLVGFIRKIPLVKYRPLEKRPASLDQWYGLEKLERTLRILKDDHDAAIVVIPTPDPPPPQVKRLAPQTYNRGSRGQDARYCVNSPGVTQLTATDWVDEGGYHYDQQGLCLGGRTGNPVDGLKPSDAMDGAEPCDPYTWGTRSFPPWPQGSYET